MRIEAILPPSGRQTLWQLQFEDGKALAVAEELLLDFSLHQGMELDEDTYARLHEAQVRAKLRKQAANILLHRPHSKGELRRKLLRTRGTDPAQAEAACDWAERVGLLDEAAYAARLVQRCQERGFGLYRIREELYRREIPKSLWDEALAALQPGEAAIDRYLSRHLKSTEPRELKRVSDALARRGFSWTEIAAGIRRHGGPEAEDE